MVVVGPHGAAGRWTVCMRMRFTLAAQKQIDGRFVTTWVLPIRRDVSPRLYLADTKGLYSGRAV
jgi:hypothetical protein